MIEFLGEAAHIHLLFERVELGKLMGNIKTVTSGKLRNEYSEHLSKFYWSKKPLFWSGSDAIISVGVGATLSRLIKYVTNQEKPE